MTASMNLPLPGEGGTATITIAGSPELVRRVFDAMERAASTEIQAMRHIPTGPDGEPLLVPPCRGCGKE